MASNTLKKVCSETLRQKATPLGTTSTFAVVEKLLCEDWYVEHSPVLPLGVLLFMAKNKAERDKKLRNIGPHSLTDSEWWSFISLPIVGGGN